MANLCFVCNLNNKAANRKRRLINEVVINALRSHVPRQNTAIGSQSSHGDPDVVIDLEQLLLVRGKLRGGFVHSGQHHMRLGP